MCIVQIGSHGTDDQHSLDVLRASTYISIDVLIHYVVKDTTACILKYLYSTSTTASKHGQMCSCI